MAVAPQIGRGGADVVANATQDLYRQYGRQIFAYCMQRLTSREEAEDAVQTTFLNAFRGLQRGTVPESEQAWLFAIAKNVCGARRSSSVRRLRLETPNNFEVLQEVIPSPRGSGADELIGLEAALEGMPENQRRAILLREWQGLSYREISAELDLSQNAVEMLIFRARRSLATALEQPSAPKRRRRVSKGLDLGWLLGGIKTLLFGGGAAAKIAAAVAVVSASTIVAAAPVVHTLRSHPKPGGLPVGSGTVSRVWGAAQAGTPAPSLAIATVLGSATVRVRRPPDAAGLRAHAGAPSAANPAGERAIGGGIVVAPPSAPAPGAPTDAAPRPAEPAPAPTASSLVPGQAKKPDDRGTSASLPQGQVKKQDAAAAATAASATTTHSLPPGQVKKQDRAAAATAASATTASSLPPGQVKKQDAAAAATAASATTTHSLPPGQVKKQDRAAAATAASATTASSLPPGQVKKQDAAAAATAASATTASSLPPGQAKKQDAAAAATAAPATPTATSQTPAFSSAAPSPASPATLSAPSLPPGQAKKQDPTPAVPPVAAPAPGAPVNPVPPGQAKKQEASAADSGDNGKGKGKNT